MQLGGIGVDTCSSGQTLDANKGGPSRHHPLALLQRCVCVCMLVFARIPVYLCAHLCVLLLPSALVHDDEHRFAHSSPRVFSRYVHALSHAHPLFSLLLLLQHPWDSFGARHVTSASTNPDFVTRCRSALCLGILSAYDLSSTPPLCLWRSVYVCWH